MKVLNFELENNDINPGTQRQRGEVLCNEIIEAAKSLPETFTLGSSRSLPVLNTLQLEHDQLELNLK